MTYIDIQNLEFFRDNIKKTIEAYESMINRLIFVKHRTEEIVANDKKVIDYLSNYEEYEEHIHRLIGECEKMKALYETAKIMIEELNCI